MLHELFEQQKVANSIENERFELKNAANTVETAASSSKMLQIPPKFCKCYGKWEVPTPKCCKESWNGSFQSQNAANSQENGQKNRSPPKKKQHGKKAKQFWTHIWSIWMYHRPTKNWWVNIVFLPESLVSSSVAPGFLVSTGSAPLDWVAKHSSIRFDSQCMLWMPSKKWGISGKASGTQTWPAGKQMHWCGIFPYFPYDLSLLCWDFPAMLDDGNDGNPHGILVILSRTMAGPVWATGMRRSRTRSRVKSTACSKGRLKKSVEIFLSWPGLNNGGDIPSGKLT